MAVFMGPETQHHFAQFRLDAVNYQLWSGREAICLRPKTFEVLRYLVERPGQLVTKSALLDAMWPDVAVGDTMPALCVAELRKSLGDNPKTPRFIETVHRRGYRFIADVRTVEGSRLVEKALAPVQRPATILVGRDAELARMRAQFEEMLAGARRVIFVSGEAGIGKTSFVQEFLDHVVQSRGAPVGIGRGQCVEQYGGGEPYLPILEALTRLCKQGVCDSFTEILDHLAPSWLAEMPCLHTPAMRQCTHSPRQSTTRPRMLREIAEALEAFAVEMPIVLLLEDLHWSDASTIDLIAVTAQRIEPARLMIIGTYRPLDELASSHPLRKTTEHLRIHHESVDLPLRLLSEEDVASYLAQRLRGFESERSLRRIGRVIHRRSGGNPLFMVSVVDHLLEHHALSDAARIETPRNIIGMIERHLERLTPDERLVLESASVAGEEFSTASVAAAAAIAVEEAETRCTQIARSGQFLIGTGSIEWPDGTIAASFRFRHGLYCEVLYGQIAVGRRAKMHHRLAERQERAYGTHAREIAAELAQHYARSRDRDKAIHYFQLAGERALARGAAVEAHDNYNVALANLLELPTSVERDHREFALQVELGMALRGAKNWTRSAAFRTMSRAMQLGEMLGRTKELPEVLFALAAVSLSRGQAKASLEFGERMLGLAQVEADPGLIAAAHYRIGSAKLLGGKLAESRDFLDLAAHGPADGGRLARDAHIHSRAMAAVAVLRLGLPDRARQLLSEAFELSRRHGTLYNEGFAHMSAILVHDGLHEPQGVLEHADALSRIAEDNPAYLTFADGSAGTALFMLEEHEEGLARMRRALASGEFGLDDAARRVLEAQVCAIDGRPQDGLAAIQAGLRAAQELQFYKPQLLRLRANFLAQTGGAEGMSESAFVEAIECARQQDNKFDELESALCYARWLAAQGRCFEARECIAEIYHWFTEGFDTLVLKEARNLLEDLGKKPARIEHRPAGTIRTRGAYTTISSQSSSSTAVTPADLGRHVTARRTRQRSAP